MAPGFRGLQPITLGKAWQLKGLSAQLRSMWHSLLTPESTRKHNAREEAGRVVTLNILSPQHHSLRKLMSSSKVPSLGGSPQNSATSWRSIVHTAEPVVGHFTLKPQVVSLSLCFHCQRPRSPESLCAFFSLCPLERWPLFLASNLLNTTLNP